MLKLHCLVKNMKQAGLFGEKIFWLHFHKSNWLGRKADKVDMATKPSFGKSEGG